MASEFESRKSKDTFLAWFMKELEKTQKNT